MSIWSFFGFGCNAAARRLLDESFNNMVRTFVPAMVASTTRAVIEYRIRGCGAWHVVIADQACRLHQGRAPNPDLSLAMTRQTWLAIADGAASGAAMFRARKLRATGDQYLLMQLPQLFDRDNYH